MKLKDLETVFGYSIETLVRSGKKFKLYSFLLFVLDIAVVCGLTAIMFTAGASPATYGYVLVGICILVTLVVQYRLTCGVLDLGQFYIRHKKVDLIGEFLSLDCDEANGVLASLNLPALETASLASFCEILTKYCQHGSANCITLYDKLKNYIAKAGNIKVMSVKAGKKKVVVNITTDCE